MAVAYSTSDSPQSLGEVRCDGRCSPQEAISLIAVITDQVASLHEAGRLHLRICRESIRFVTDAGPVLSEPDTIQHFSRDVHRDVNLPRELRDVLPLDVPSEIALATRVLREHHVTLDARQIDFFQLGTLACQLIAGSVPGEYLRSARVKSRVPTSLRPFLERAWGIDGRTRFRGASEFLEELVRVDRLLSAPAESPTTAPISIESDGALQAPRESLPREIESVTDTGHHSRLGSYELLERIGAGGMGEVYLGYDRALGRRVAVKVLPVELARHSDFVQRFYAEASAAARVTHPNVIPIHFIGEDQGRHFFVMPFIEGESLAGRLSRQGRFTAEAALPIVDDVLAGLQAAHSQGLIHRDIKPGNILLEAPSGRAVVADFGLVKSLGEAGGRTATGVVLGTVDYMAPEQGRGRTVDHRCDLYAVGVLLYQLLSGRLPFVADSPTGMIFQHVYERPTPLPELIPGLAAPLWAVIARLMAKSPEVRFSSAQAVRDDLRAARLGQPLPSGTERNDLETYWRPTVNRPDDRPLTMIIEAPTFDADPEEPPLSPGIGWWDRLRDKWQDWWAGRRPGWVAALETTQQQADGAIAEYTRRRDQLRALVREAESVLADLNAQRGRAPDAADLSGLIGGQADQLDTMQLKLAQVEAILGRIRSQRDLLNARLKAAKAQAQIQQGVTVHSRRLLIVPTAAQAAILITLFGVLALIVRARWPVITALISEPRIEQQSVKQSVASTPTASNTKPIQRAATAERHLAVSRDGFLAVTAQFSSPITAPASGSVNRGPVEIKAWDLASGSEILTFEDPHCSRELALSTDRSMLLSAGEDCQTGLGELRLWDVRTGKLRQRIETSIPPKVSGIGFSPDGMRAFAITGALQSQQLTIVDLNSGRTSNMPMPQPGDRVTAAAISPSSEIAAIGIVQSGYSGRIAIDIHDVRQRRMSTSIPCSANVQKLAFSADGRFLAASEWGAIKIYETENWTVVAALPGEKSGHSALSLSHDGELVAVMRDRHVQVWNVATQSAISLNSPSDALDLAFGSAGTLIVLPSSSRFSFFDAATGKELLGIKRPMKMPE